MTTQILRPHALAAQVGRWVRGWVALLAAPGALLAPGCKLAEVSTAPGDDLVVVESVLRAGSPRQTLLLHHSIQGTTVRGEPGATVRIVAPGGAELPFAEVPLGVCAGGLSPARTDSIEVRATCYAAARTGLVVTPGATYELHVTTLDGREIRGRTTVPGAFALRSIPPGRVGGIDCALPPRTNLPLAWSVASGAWSYVTGMEIRGLAKALAGTRIDAPDTLELSGVAVSERDTTLMVPSDLGVFELGSADQRILRLLQDGFPDGVAVHLTIAAADRNFINAVRGGAFNPSGNVRISSVVGDGAGLFGSLVPHSLDIQVGTGLPYPSCLVG